MAKERVSAPAEEGNSLPEWQKERIYMARLVSKHILDPIMNFSFIASLDNDACLEAEEIHAILRLLVIGGYADVKTYCVRTGGGIYPLARADFIEDVGKEWLEAANSTAGGAA